MAKSNRTRKGQTAKNVNNKTEVDPNDNAVHVPNEADVAEPQTAEGGSGEAGDALPKTVEGATGAAEPQAVEGGSGEAGDALPKTAEGATGAAEPQTAEGGSGEAGDALPKTVEGATGAVEPQAVEGESGEATKKNKYDYKTIIKWGFGVAASCILWLTVLASIILITNQCSQKNASYSMMDLAKYYSKDSIDDISENIMKFHVDSTGKSVISIDEQNVSNTELYIPEPSGILDSIVYNLTLAVNSINNVLTSGSILIAILTLFIALVGIFAYIDLKKDVTSSMDKARTDIKDFKTEISENIASDNEERELFEKNIKESYQEVQQKMQFLENRQIKQTRFFKKSKEYLYTISNCLLDLSDKGEELNNELYHDLHIITLYHYEPDENSKEYADLIQEKIEAIENLKNSGTLDDIPDLEIVAKNEHNDEIRKQIQGLIGIINYKNNQS